MTILAQYQNIPVEVIEVFQAGGRTRVLIRALSGEPFTRYSMGGPVNTDSTLTSVDLLTEIHIDRPEPARPIRRSRQPGFVKPEPVYTDMEEYSALWPVRQRTGQPGRGGINQD